MTNSQFIHAGNPKFNATIWQLEQARTFLLLSGFEQVQKSNILIVSYFFMTVFYPCSHQLSCWFTLMFFILQLLLMVMVMCLWERWYSSCVGERIAGKEIRTPGTNGSYNLCNTGWMLQPLSYSIQEPVISQVIYLCCCTMYPTGLQARQCKRDSSSLSSSSIKIWLITCDCCPSCCFLIVVYQRWTSSPW